MIHNLKHNSGTKLLVASLSIFMLVGALWGQPWAPQDQLRGPEAFEQTTVTQTTVANEVASAGSTEDEKTAANDEGEITALAAIHEAAAGPQPEDAGPSAPEPNLALDAPLLMKRVGIQAGHWKSYELPAELAGLRTSTGTSGGGVAEWELNLDIARRAAPLIEAEGYEVDILPATIPPGYQADAFVALHADGDVTGRLSGFKLAGARVSSIPEADDALLKSITEEYRAATKLSVDSHVSRNMTGYYAWSFRRFKHAIAPTTPAVLLEMGFMTNASDRQLLLNSRDVVAEGVARGILRVLGDTSE